MDHYRGSLPVGVMRLLVGRDDSRGFLLGGVRRCVAHIQQDDIGDEEDEQGPAPKGVEERLLLALGFLLLLRRRRRRRRGGGRRRRGWDWRKGLFPLLLLGGGIGHPVVRCAWEGACV